MFYISNNSNSRIYSRTLANGDIVTETKNNPSGLVVDIVSERGGKDGTGATIGFESAPNRFLKVDGRQLRTLHNALSKHFNQF